jgi:hypothetical protein
MTTSCLLVPFDRAFGDAAEDLFTLTGAHTRIVWVQDQSSTNSDTLALGRELKLMGFDNRDGRGERAILSEVQNYAKPLLTPDGKRIVYSERYGKDIFVVNWDGTGQRRIGSGYAVEVWADPKTSETWVYAGTQVGKLDSINFKSLRRILLDGGSRWEPVWDKTEISPDNFQLSADGTFAAGEFPWPHAGTADLAAKTWRKRADGCWASIAPDNSGLCWVFDGPHRNVYLYPRTTSSNWKVSLNTVPGFGNYEVFHPRWSNHVRYLVITGPYKVKTSVNFIAGGGPDVEVYVGRFGEDFRSVEAWARVTNNSHGDFHPDVWIEGGEKSTIPSNVFKQEIQETAVADHWPGSSQGLVFVWENAAAQNVITTEGEVNIRTCRVEARGKAKYNRFFDMDCRGGSFVAEQIGPELLQACQKSNELTIEAAITSTSADQSGPARIIAFTGKTGISNFMLGQDRDSLVFDLATKRRSAGGNTSTIRLGKIVSDQLLHLVLTYSDGQLSCYLDGKQTDLSGKPVGDFSGWTEQQLVFGADHAGKHNWSGKLEGIAIFDRALTADEAIHHFELFSSRLDNRPVLNHLRVRATCLELSQIPDPRTIVPYRRAIVVNRYRIEKIIEGKIEDREILVAQWGILDKAAVKETKLRVGQSVELLLEGFEDHPELKSERQIVDVEGLDLPWYYAIGK